MAIPVVCPGCKKSFNVDDKHAGKTGPCPNCKAKITIPEKKAEVKIHAPDEFAGGGKGVTGKLLLKPIARQQTRINPVMAAAIGGAVLAAIIVALVMRGLAADRVALRYVLSGVGLLLASPALAVTAYTFLRDDELDAYRGTQLLVRAAVCGVVYMVLWAGFAYLKTTLGTISLPIWALVAPPFLIVGAMAGKFSFDLETANGFFHYAFYVAVTMLLGAIAGLGWAWQ
jgi:DNA-directed RNA polymerase subunit RPC12/RpoP